jgi:hypothetical protein
MFINIIMSIYQRVYCITEGTNVFGYSDEPFTVCPNNAGHTINPDSISGNNTLGLDIFGDGSDGNLTISSNTSLTRDSYFNNLTITNGARLSTANYRLFVAGMLTITNGFISNNGNNANANTAGAGTGTARTCGIGTNGAAGVGNANGANGTAMTASTRGGGLGGNGGSSATRTAGLAGTGTVVPTNNGGVNCLRQALTAITMRDMTNTLINGGTGGGSGGGTISGSSGAGGGGAGTILISAQYISWVTATISANGGNGGTSVTLNSASGGGGGGGLVVVISKSNLTGLTITANGGSGGSANGTGNAGLAGNNGNIFTIEI